MQLDKIIGISVKLRIVGLTKFCNFVARLATVVCSSHSILTPLDENKSKIFLSVNRLTTNPAPSSWEMLVAPIPHRLLRQGMAECKSSRLETGKTAPCISCALLWSVLYNASKQPHKCNGITLVSIRTINLNDIIKIMTCTKIVVPF